VPPKTEYSLTPLGNKLCATIYEMYKFGHELYEHHSVMPRCGCREDLSRIEKVLKDSNK
jgi:DNA-binding HxlR family transcriptional regulator